MNTKIDADHMQENRLTVIIPFLNEGNEVERTISSIKEYSTNNPDIILINDASTDNFDYESIAGKYNCRYVCHQQRMGVAASRQEGVDLCRSSHFLLLDAHMRFYDKRWDEKLLIYLAANPRSVICSQTKVLRIDAKGEVVEDMAHEVRCAGFIDFGERELFRVMWNHTDLEPYTNLIEVPCIIGAAYACSTEYWKLINGLEGLKTYGTDEELLSMKVWLEGGRCLLVRDWVVGHIYRNEFPYPVPGVDVVYNRLFVAELLLSYPLKRELFYKMRLTYKDNYLKAYNMIKENYFSIRKHKQYLKSVFTQDLSYFMEINRRAIELNKHD